MSESTYCGGKITDNWMAGGVAAGKRYCDVRDRGVRGLRVQPGTAEFPGHLRDHCELTVLSTCNVQTTSIDFANYY